MLLLARMICFLVFAIAASTLVSGIRENETFNVGASAGFMLWSFALVLELTLRRLNNT